MVEVAARAGVIGLQKSDGGGASCRFALPVLGSVRLRRLPFRASGLCPSSEEPES